MESSSLVGLPRGQLKVCVGLKGSQGDCVIPWSQGHWAGRSKRLSQGPHRGAVCRDPGRGAPCPEAGVWGTQLDSRADGGQARKVDGRRDSQN